MKFISLFSGIGGFDLGFERAGMECVAQVEIDKNCLQLLGEKFPNAQRHNDVKEFHYDGRSIDLVCGGFPCQDLSIAGKRAGLAGKRSGLWFEFHRILSELTPRWVVIENVPGLLSSNGGRDFAVILRGLGELGYLSSWRILDAQYFGVPQRRRRVFIVASLGTGRSAQVLFEREGVLGDIAPSREAGKDVVYSLRSNPSHSGDKGDGGLNTTLIAADVAPTLEAEYFKKRYSNQQFVSQNGDGFPVYKIRGGKEGGGKGYLGSNETTFTVTGFNDQYLGVRRLTPTECERLQGFPDGWTSGFADTVRYRMLGNAVAVPCAEWIGNRIMEAE